MCAFPHHAVISLSRTSKRPFALLLSCSHSLFKEEDLFFQDVRKSLWVIWHAWGLKLNLRKRKKINSQFLERQIHQALALLYYPRAFLLRAVISLPRTSQRPFAPLLSSSHCSLDKKGPRNCFPDTNERPWDLLACMRSKIEIQHMESIPVYGERMA